MVDCNLGVCDFLLSDESNQKRLKYGYLSYKRMDSLQEAGEACL